MNDVKFKEFITKETLHSINSEIDNVTCVDWNYCIGDTILEKFKTLFFQIQLQTNKLVKNGASGYFWIVGSHDIMALFDVALNTPLLTSDEHFEIKNNDKINYKGMLSSKWRLYECNWWLPDGSLIIGCNDNLQDSKHYLRINVWNL